MQFPVLFALTLILLFPPVPAFARSLDCVRSVDTSTSSKSVGVETIHRMGNTTITIFLPMPKVSNGVLDLNSLGYDAVYPERFTMSDGTIQTAFIELDLRGKSSLRNCVDEMAQQVRSQASSKDAMLDLLKDYISQHLEEVPDGARFSWDPKRERALPDEFKAAADLTPGHYPLKTGLQHPSVAIEAFLKQGKGACLPKVMLTSLIMKELGLRHRVRTGSTGELGHMWIELPDGRHLDPTWKLLKRPISKGMNPGWFRFDQTYLYENQFFPVAVD